MDFQNQKGMIIGALIISGLLIAGYLMIRGKGSERPLYNTNEPIPIPEDVLQDQQKEKQIRELLAQNPEDPALIAEFGDVFFERGDFLQAIPQYEKALELAPNDVDTYNDLGLSYHYTGRSEEAVNSFRKGIEKDPSFQRIWLSLGFVQASNNNLEEARKALKKVVEIDPDTDIALEAQRILSAMP